jgi:hypothetical protein
MREAGSKNVTRKIVAIHQPNFFPWLGYFDKIARADVFILMDNVQFSKKGGTWENRVRLIVGGKAAWVTMPVFRSFHGNLNVNEVRINNATAWRGNLLKIVRTNYGRAPFFNQVFSFFSELVNNPTDVLADYNRAAIETIANSVGLDANKMILGSTLDVSGAATELLIRMTRAVGGTAYLAGGGAGGYQEDEKFAAAGIELIYQNFQQLGYPQFNSTEFIPGLSIIDALMNVGFDGLKVMLTTDPSFLTE